MTNLTRKQIIDAVDLTLQASVEMVDILGDQMNMVSSGNLLVTTHLITIALLREIRDELRRLADTQE